MVFFPLCISNLLCIYQILLMEIPLNIDIFGNLKFLKNASFLYGLLCKMECLLLRRFKWELRIFALTQTDVWCAIKKMSLLFISSSLVLLLSVFGTRLMLLLGWTNPYQDLKDLCGNLCYINTKVKKKGLINFNLIVAAIWTIWLERNKRIFNNTCVSIINIWKDICNLTSLLSSKNPLLAFNISAFIWSLLQCWAYLSLVWNYFLFSYT